MSTAQHPLSGLGFVPEQASPPKQHPLAALGFQPEGRPSEAEQAEALAPSTMAAAQRRFVVPKGNLPPGMDYAGMEAGGGGAPSSHAGIPAPPPPLRPAGETLAQGATRELGPAAKWVGAGALTMAAPEVGIPTAVALATLGGAGGEAAHQIAQRIATPPEAPKSSTEAATKIGVAGAETGAAELVGRGGLKLAGAVAKRFFNPAGQAIEDVFRAGGPPSDPGFRANVEVAANDLGNAYKRTPIPAEAKGGIINPDMRIRASVDAINNELRNIYQTERAAQIGQAAQIGTEVPVKIDPMVLADVSKRLSRTLPINSHELTVVNKLMQQPTAALPVTELDSLARAVNTMLRDFEAMTPAERQAAGITRRMAGLKELDRGLAASLNGKLQELGMPGLQDYERRYAALSAIRDALESKMNKAEAARWSMRLREFFSPSGLHGGVTGNLTVSPGRRIESGMRELSTKSTPTPAIPPPPKPKGLLPAPPTEATPLPGPPDTSGTVRGGRWTTPKALLPAPPGPPPTQTPVGTLPPLEFPATTPNTMWSGTQPKAGFEQPSKMVSSLRPPENVKGPSITASEGAGRSSPARGIVSAEFKKLKLTNLLTPRQQTTLETLINGPRYKGMDSVDREAAIRSVLTAGKP